MVLKSPLKTGHEIRLYRTYRAETEHRVQNCTGFTGRAGNIELYYWHECGLQLQSQKAIRLIPNMYT